MVGPGANHTKRSKPERDRFMLYDRESKIRYKQTYLQNRNRFTYIEFGMVTKREGESNRLGVEIN